jgi:hypothetical protein
MPKVAASIGPDDPSARKRAMALSKVGNSWLGSAA